MGDGNPDEAQPPSVAPEAEYSTVNEIHDRTERTFLNTRADAVCGFSPSPTSVAIPLGAPTGSAPRPDAG